MRSKPCTCTLSAFAGAAILAAVSASAARLFQVGELQLELLDQRPAFRRLAKPLMAQFGDGKLQLRNLQRPRMRLCLGAAHLRFRLDPRCALGDQHRLQRRNVVGQGIGSAHRQ